MTSLPWGRHDACDPAVVVTLTRQEILREIEAIGPPSRPRDRVSASPRPRSWPPVGFYLTFYIVAGTTSGSSGASTSFIFNVVGSLLVNQDPLRFLRVYGTFFLGARALTTDDLNFFMLVAVVHFSVGAAPGAVFHVLVNRFVPARRRSRSRSVWSTGSSCGS